MLCITELDMSCICARVFHRFFRNGHDLTLNPWIHCTGAIPCHFFVWGQFLLWSTRRVKLPEIPVEYYDLCLARMHTFIKLRWYQSQSFVDLLYLMFYFIANIKHLKTWTTTKTAKLSLWPGIDDEEPWTVFTKIN